VFRYQLRAIINEPSTIKGSCFLWDKRSIAIIGEI